MGRGLQLLANNLVTVVLFSLAYFDLVKFLVCEGVLRLQWERLCSLQ